MEAQTKLIEQGSGQLSASTSFRERKPASREMMSLEKEMVA
jgi:hypothetical protein